MRVLQVNQSDNLGGAARAAHRIHKAIIRQNFNSKMLVNVRVTDDWTVKHPIRFWEKARARISPLMAKTFRSLLKTRNPALHSPNIIPSSWLSYINESNADLVNLHWVGWEMLSISDIGKINKPLVWTLHDMWAFCGAEHFTYEFRWRDGYQKTNRPPYESGFDLNRWNWNRKLANWKQPINIIAPSNWLANCIKESALMHNWPITVIPNPLDLNIWKPADKKISRQLLGLPLDVPLVLFGALGGGIDPNKGFDLLVKALEHLKGNEKNFELVVFGQGRPQNPNHWGFKVHYTGHLGDDISLRLVYSAADLMVVPSRLEAFGQTASEAQACGVPVVAFNVGGLRDIVDHKITGYLANPFDSADLAFGIEHVLSSPEKHLLGSAARKKAEIFFDSTVVAKKYIEVYEGILAKNSSLIRN